MKRKQRCEACKGRGVFAPALPSCGIEAAKLPWIVVERCDSCDQFDDDVAAALSLFRVAGWFQCQSGFFHALANKHTWRARQRRAPIAPSRA